MSNTLGLEVIALLMRFELVIFDGYLKTPSLRHRISPVPHRPGLVVGHEWRLEREETSLVLRNLHLPAPPPPSHVQAATRTRPYPYAHPRLYL